MTKETATKKPIRWMGDSRQRLREFPKEVRSEIGQALYEAELGEAHPSARPMTGLNAVEIVSDYRGDTYRGIYTTQFKGQIYVLHCFQKKSKTGIKTPKRDLELILSACRSQIGRSVSEEGRVMTKRIMFEEGSGNIFADIGLPNPEEALAKAELARRVNRILVDRGLSQVEAGRILGIPQPRVSDLARGRLVKFSLEKLLDFAKRLGNDIEIRLKPARRPHLTIKAAAGLPQPAFASRRKGKPGARRLEATAHPPVRLPRGRTKASDNAISQ